MGEPATASPQGERSRDELIALDAVGANGPYRARQRLTVTDVAGVPVAELSLVPPLFVRRSLAALRKGRTMPAAERAAALTRAGQAFASSTIDGLSPAEHERMVSRVSGLPISVVRRATHMLSEAASHAAAQADGTTSHARPAGAVDDWRDPSTLRGRAVWTRRGDVFAAHASGNHPGVHSLWLEALGLGYRVAVRPSRREPFTSHRLVSALRDAGFGSDQLALLPTEHAVADEIISGADLSIVFGGDEVVDRYAHDSTVLTQGPGRSKILLTGSDWRSHLDTIVDSISDEGGVGCVNASVVLVEGDPAPVAEAIAQRLAAIPSLPPEDEDAALPVQPLASARALESYLRTCADGARAWLGGDGIVYELGDGSAVLRPALFQVDRPDAPQTAVELGFPCAWVAPWSPSEDGIEPLRRTLVITAITDDDELVDRLVDDPTISNVYVGDHPTHRMEPWLPHDGYMGEFLMRTKAVIRG
jgi:acyl-CoA reductase-like NAD-dependent aldehyde dehydrogenase